MRNALTTEGVREGLRAGTLLCVLVCGAQLAACSPQAGGPPATQWNRVAAATYLDRRMDWWMGWRSAQRGHGTFCVSCHTSVPYALARPALTAALAEPSQAPDELKLLENVRQRVRLWGHSDPYYTEAWDGTDKSVEARGTEAVLNALTLAWYDARGGHLSPEAAQALDDMWAMQLRDGDERGSWAWLDFDAAPWELGDAQFYGAALAALAVGVAPDAYQKRPQIQDQLGLLRGYLASHYQDESLHHRLIALWASTRLPGVVSADQSLSLVEAVLHAQNPDGGWSLSSLVNRTTKQGRLLRDTASDGYGTALVVFVLEEAKIAGVSQEVDRGLQWLVSNQRGAESWVVRQNGAWSARSMNVKRNPWGNVGRFMSDAATAYAVLALTDAAATPPQWPTARN